MLVVAPLQVLQVPLLALPVLLVLLVPVLSQAPEMPPLVLLVPVLSQAPEIPPLVRTQPALLAVAQESPKSTSRLLKTAA